MTNQTQNPKLTNPTKKSLNSATKIQVMEKFAITILCVFFGIFWNWTIQHFLSFSNFFDSKRVCSIDIKCYWIYLRFCTDLNIKWNKIQDFHQKILLSLDIYRKNAPALRSGGVKKPYRISVLSRNSFFAWNLSLPKDIRRTSNWPIVSVVNLLKSIDSTKHTKNGPFQGQHISFDKEFLKQNGNMKSDVCPNSLYSDYELLQTEK